MEKKHLNITVRGIVQGVFFRNSTQEEAKRLKVKGFVRNQPDGTVYIEAEGSKEQLDKLLGWLPNGSKHASVEDIEYDVGAMQDYDGFTIRH